MSSWGSSLNDQSGLHRTWVHQPARSRIRAASCRMVDDIYLQFLEAVAAGRALPLAQVQDLADGRTFWPPGSSAGVGGRPGPWMRSKRLPPGRIATGIVREPGRRPGGMRSAGMPAADLLLPTESWRMR